MTLKWSRWFVFGDFFHTSWWITDPICLRIFTRWWFQIFFYVHPYLGKIPILTNIFQMGWNHQGFSLFGPRKVSPSGFQEIAGWGCRSRLHSGINDHSSLENGGPGLKMDEPYWKWWFFHCYVSLPEGKSHHLQESAEFGRWLFVGIILWITSSSVFVSCSYDFCRKKLISKLGNDSMVAVLFGFVLESSGCVIFSVLKTTNKETNRGQLGCPRKLVKGLQVGYTPNIPHL